MAASLPYNSRMQPYDTIEGTASAEYEEKKSRFIAQVAHVETEDEALSFLENVRQANPMARHNVYAYVLRADNRVRYSDDGEPARTSGLPTLEVIQHAGLTDVICVTTRYFGGTLLGTGGLVRAYTKAATDAIAAAQRITFAPCCDITVRMGYALYDQVSHWAAQAGAQVVSTDFAADITLVLRVRSEDAETTVAGLREFTRAQASVACGEESFQPLQVSSD